MAIIAALVRLLSSSNMMFDSIDVEVNIQQVLSSNVLFLMFDSSF